MYYSNYGSVYLIYLNQVETIAWQQRTTSLDGIPASAQWLRAQRGELLRGAAVVSGAPAGGENRRTTVVSSQTGTSWGEDMETAL